MAYFITGGTGFIGRFFMDKLAEREGDIYVLTRKGSEDKFEALQQRLGDAADRLIPVQGDLREPLLGLSEATIADLKGNIKHFCHFAAIYDLKASAESQIATNIEGTRHAVQLAEAVEAGCFEHVSSIAAGGMYRGTWREDMFEEAENLEHPYFATKHDSEGIVRNECKVPWRVYRPGMVVGHSKTGEIDKIDGAYYFFKSLQKIRGTTTAITNSIGSRTMPGHSYKKWSVMSIICRPPLLRIGHQIKKIFFESLQIKAFKFFRIIKILSHRIG